MTGLQKIIPKISTSKFMDFITSKEIIAVGSAVVLTPFLLKSIEGIVSKVPFLKDHFTIGFIVAGFVIFSISFVIPNGVIRAVVIGIAGGVLITGLAPLFESSLATVFGGK